MKLKDNSSTFLIKFLFGLLVIAFLFGIYIFLNLDTNVKEGIITSLSDIKTSILEPQNFIINHIIILCVLFVLSLSVFGSILVIFYNFYEIASLGFFIASMIKYKGIYGLLFGTGVFISTTKPQEKMVKDYISLIELDDNGENIIAKPNFKTFKDE